MNLTVDLRIGIFRHYGLCLSTNKTTEICHLQLTVITFRVFKMDLDYFTLHHIFVLLNKNNKLTDNWCKKCSFVDLSAIIALYRCHFSHCFKYFNRLVIGITSLTVVHYHILNCFSWWTVDVIVYMYLNLVNHRLIDRFTMWRRIGIPREI